MQNFNIKIKEEFFDGGEMNRILITYSNEKYDIAKQKLIKSAKRLNYFDEIYDFGPVDIDNEFRRKYKNILDIERGNGLWLWKPYFIEKILKKVNENDVIFYCDAAAIFLKSPKPLESMFENLYVINIPLLEKQFTKKNTLNMMKTTTEIESSKQIIATYFILRKNKITMDLVDEWLTLCCCKNLLEPSNDDESDYFISHREDQSIFSILCKQKNIEPNIDISQRRILQYTYWSKGYIFIKNRLNMRYGIYIYLHKMPEISYGKIVRHLNSQILSNFKNMIKKYILNGN